MVGITARILLSDLKSTDAVDQLLRTYLLWAIGLKQEVPFA